MKNLKYIYALSTVFVSLFALDYKSNYQGTTSSTTSNESNNDQSSTTSSDTSATGLIIDDAIKYNIISKYNSHYSSSNELKLTKGNLIKLKDNTPITLSFTGNYLLNNNSLSSYVIDTDYSYNSSKESFEVSYGSTAYDSINYNNKVYLFSSSNELGGILSFPSTIDDKYPLINDNTSFSSIFNKFLSLDSTLYNVYKSDLGYIFKSNDLEIITDSNFNLTKVNGRSDDIKYEFNFTIKSSTSTLSSLNSNSSDIITTLKTILEDSSFDINFNADIKSKKSNNLKFVGNVKLDYSNAISKDDPLIGLNLTHYTNGNLSNEVMAQYDDNNIYFKINDLLKGSISDTTASEMISITSGLMSDSSFNYDFNNPLNELMNTDIFKNIMNLNISSLDTSVISNLEIKHNLISFGLDSSAFNLNNGIIRFEIGLNNAKLKSIKIKDFNIDDDKSINLEMYLNTPRGLNHLNTNEYPSYNSILPIYKNVISIMNEGKIGGDFSTSIFDSSSSQTLALSTHYDVNFRNAISNMSIDNLILSLSNLKINFIDETDVNRTSSTVTALFLEDTTSKAKSSFNIEINNLNFQNNTFYIELKNNNEVSKYTTTTSSIKSLINSVKTLTGGTNSSNNTDKGFNAIQNEIKRLDYLVYFIMHNEYVKEAINDIKNNYSLKELENFFTISNIGDGIFNIEFDMYNLVGQNSFVFRDYNLSRNCSILVGGNGSLLGLNVNGLDVDGMSVSTHLGKTYYDSSNVLDKSKIESEWKEAKDLNEITNKVNGLINTFSAYKNTYVNKLIDITFAYNKKDNDGNITSKLTTSGKLNTKIHFNENGKVDDTYFEGDIPLTFSNSKEVSDNTVNGLNAKFIYTDNNAFDNDENETSKFTNLINNDYLSEGCQIGISLNYSANDDRNNSKLYAYSTKDTIDDILYSLSTGLKNDNTLYPYEVIRLVQQYSEKIYGILNSNNSSSSNNSSIITTLKNLGITDLSSITSLLNKINSDSNTITAITKVSNMNLKIEITLSTTMINDKEAYDISAVKVNSIDDNNEYDNNLSATFDFKDSDTSTSIINEETFTPFKKANDNNTHYIGASNVYNLLQLGIYTTNKKYYRLTGTLNFSSSGSVKLLGSINTKLLNNIYFDIKLNLFNDLDKTKYAYKIKGYLKVAINDTGTNDPDAAFNNKFTEYFIEPGDTEDKGNIYIFRSNGKTYQTEKLEIAPEEFQNQFANSKYANDYFYYGSYEGIPYEGSEAYYKSEGALIGQYDSEEAAQNAITAELSKRKELQKSDFTYSRSLDTSEDNIFINKTDKDGKIYPNDNSQIRDYNTAWDKYKDFVDGLVELHYLNESDCYKEKNEYIYFDKNNIFNYGSEETFEEEIGYEHDDSHHGLFVDYTGTNEIIANYVKQYPELDGKLESYSYQVEDGKTLLGKPKYKTLYGIRTKKNTSIDINEYSIRASKNITTAIYGKLFNVTTTRELSFDPEYQYYVYTLGYKDKNKYDVEMYMMDKSKFLGNITIKNTDTNSTGTVSVIMYYLLDYSEIISEDASIKKWKFTVKIRNILLGSIYESTSTSSSSPKINYLSGWDLTVNGTTTQNGDYKITNGTFIIDPHSLIPDGVKDGGNNVSFGSALKLYFTNLSSEKYTDIYNFTLSQTSNNNLINASSGDAATISLKIDTSYFRFIASNDDDYITTQMYRYTNYIKNYKEYFNIDENSTDLDSYPETIYTKKGGIYYIFDKVEWIEFSSVEYHKSSKYYYNGKLPDSKFFEGL